MNKTVKRSLHLLIISTITVVFGVLTAFGVSAEVGERFTVNTIEYKITSEGAFPEVEVAPYQQKYSLSITTLPEFVVNPSNNLVYRVTSIGNYAFYTRERLTSNGDDTFYACISLENITIPDSVTRIGDYAFYACESLTSITIPDSVTSIGNHAFEYCKNLTNITISDSVTSIGNYAFADCKDLSKVYCNGLNPPHSGKYVFDYCSSNLTIYVPEGTIDTYVAAGWPEANLVE